MPYFADYIAYPCTPAKPVCDFLTYCLFIAFSISSATFRKSCHAVFADMAGKLSVFVLQLHNSMQSMPFLYYAASCYSPCGDAGERCAGGYHGSDSGVGRAPFRVGRHSSAWWITAESGGAIHQRSHFFVLKRWHPNKPPRGVDDVMQ